MKHTNLTQWGGRVGRYTDFKGAVGRCFDPFARQSVQFEFAFEYEAWLKSRFHSDTHSITHQRTQVIARQHESELSAVATFVVTDRVGRKHYHLAVSNREAEGRTRTLDRVAALTAATVVVTSRDELRRDVELFWRLELLRQVCQLYEGEGTEFDPQVMAAVHAGADSRDAVISRLHHLHAPLVTVRLVHLHCLGLLLLNFCRDDFAVSLGDGAQL